MTRLFPILVCSLAWIATAMGQLSWKSMSLTFTPPYGTESVSGDYEFRNTGTTTVNIVAVQPGCGCTTVDLSKMTYAPGESGTMHATMHLATQGGDRRKMIYVRTDAEDPAKRLYVLSIEANVPEVASLSKRLLIWQADSPLNPQTSELKVPVDQPIHIKSAVSKSDAFRVVTVAREAGKVYEIQVVPISTDKSHSTRIDITTDFPADNPIKFHLYARVLKQAPAASP